MGCGKIADSGGGVCAGGARPPRCWRLLVACQFEHLAESSRLLGLKLCTRFFLHLNGQYQSDNIPSHQPGCHAYSWKPSSHQPGWLEKM